MCVCVCVCIFLFSIRVVCSETKKKKKVFQVYFYAIFHFFFFCFFLLPLWQSFCPPFLPLHSIRQVTLTFRPCSFCFLLSLCPFCSFFLPRLLFAGAFPTAFPPPVVPSVSVSVSLCVCVSVCLSFFDNFPRVGWRVFLCRLSFPFMINVFGLTFQLERVYSFSFMLGHFSF